MIWQIAQNDCIITLGFVELFLSKIVTPTIFTRVKDDGMYRVIGGVNKLQEYLQSVSLLLHPA